MNKELAEIARAIGARITGNYDNVLINGVSTDSRKIKRGDLFVALKGSNHDGHDFVRQALEAGAAAAVVERNLDCGPLLVVPDTLKALQELAAWHRKHFDIPVIAVTGSVGKTTAKDLLAASLEEEFNTLKTHLNYNNEIGVPLTLLELSPHHQVLVVELGMRAPGEIEQLARIVGPTAAVITNVAPVHLETLGSLQNIARAKCEVLAYTRDFAVLNGDSPELRETAVFTKGPVYWFGCSEGCQWRLVSADTDRMGTRIQADFEGKLLEFTLSFPAGHLAASVIAAAGTAMLLGVSPQAIQKGLDRFVPSDHRMHFMTGRNNTLIIDDTYNASPLSMAAALKVLAHTAGEARKIAVLGDMFELGTFEQEGHLEVGKEAAVTGVDILITIGNRSRLIARGAAEKGLRGEIRSFDSKEEALDLLKQITKPGDVILVKASHGMHLERLVEELREAEQ